MKGTKKPTLQGLGVLVTRPAHQAEPLCQAIAASGGRALRFPLLNIEPVSPSAELTALTADLGDYHLIIFISPNAVSEGLRHLPPVKSWPKHIHCAAVGRATAAALAAQGIPDAICPEQGSDSEALLDLPELQAVDGQRVLIVRGVGGRSLLGDSLRERGAEVEYAEVYRRAAPTADVNALLAQAQGGEINVVVLTSADALRHLNTLLAARLPEWKKHVTLVVISARMVQLAQELGFTRTPWLADGASDEAVLAALHAGRRAMTAGESV